MFVKALFGKIVGSPSVLIVLAGLLMISVYINASVNDKLDETEEDLNNYKSLYQSAIDANENLAIQNQLNKDNSEASKKRAKELEEKLNNRPKERVVYVEKYIESTTASECVMDTEWLRSYNAIRDSVRSRLSAN